MSDDMMSQAKSRLKEIEEIKDIGQFIIDNSSTISAVIAGVSFETDDKRNAFVTFWEGDIISCLGLSSVCTLDIEQVIEH